MKRVLLRPALFDGNSKGILRQQARRRFTRNADRVSSGAKLGGGQYHLDGVLTISRQPSHRFHRLSPLR
jgi:hypothetical protein